MCPPKYSVIYIIRTSHKNVTGKLKKKLIKIINIFLSFKIYFIEVL
jgi:hypothetical protein